MPSVYRDLKRALVSRFVEAEQQPALPLLLEVLELEAQERHERRITRLRRASKLPPGKTFDTLDEGRLPPALVRRLRELADGDFLEDATNVLAFGLPGVGKSHAMCAVGHALIERGHTVLFMPTYSLVHHSVLLEFAVSSFRTEQAKRRGKGGPRPPVAPTS